MKNHNLKLVFFSFLLALFGVLFFGARGVNAATLYFSPSSGNFSVGNLLTTSFNVNTQEQAINNSDAVINFPTDLLEVVSISKSGSIFSLWVEEPSFSNSAGKITFNGGAPTPGYNGTSGKIINIVFRIKEAGSASLVCSSAAVRANDGFGTNVLKTCGLAQFTLVPKTATTPTPAEPAPTPSIGVPGAPKVSSTTHPDPNKWYSNNNPTFKWLLTNDISGVNVLADQKATTNPGTRSDGLRNSWTYSDVDDGKWYFHIRLRNSAGWGGITHFGFNIDTEKPDKLIAVFKDTNETNSTPIVKLESSDKTSGIDHYEIIIDGADPISWQDDGTGEYKFIALSPGEHKITIRAVDKAGNYKEIKLTRKVAGLEPPVITEYPESLEYGEEIKIKGTSKYSDGDIIIWMQRGDREPNKFLIQADSDGNFSKIISKKAKNGNYTLWTEAVNDEGLRSIKSNIVKFSVSGTIFNTLIALVIQYIWWIVGVAVSLFIFIYILTYYFRFMGKKKEKKRRSKHSPYTGLHKLRKLNKDISVHLKSLEITRKKRRLSFKESELLLQYKKLQKDITKYSGMDKQKKKKEDKLTEK